MKLSSHILALVLTLLFSATSATGQTTDYKLHKYAPNNGGILSNIAPDGKWAVINLGTTASGMSCSSELYNVDTEEHFTVAYNGRTLDFTAVSNEDAEGYVTIVGSMSSRPMAYKFKPSEPNTPGKLKILPNRTSWAVGTLTSITPDGKYAIGHYTSYTGTEIVGAELNGDYWFDGLFANLETGEVLETPGAPTCDRNGHNQHAMKFDAITPNGKYIIGEREWYMPAEGFPFIYDVEKKDFTPIGFTKNGDKMIPQKGISYLDFPTMSPNGRYIGGIAISYEDDGVNFPTESQYPYRYDMTTGELTLFTDGESANISVGSIDNNGTIFGNPETGSPLRHGKIFYQDKFWIPLTQLYNQVYGFNFAEKTGFEFSGTVTSVTGDGRKFIAFADPQGESYCFDFGTTVEEACSRFDLLRSYTVTPENSSTFSRITTIEINFGRSIQILGKGNTHAHLYKKGKNGTEDTKVRDGLSTESGLQLKSGSSTIVNVTFRNTTLDDGEDYYVVLDAGAIAVGSDITMTNKEIVINYKGRTDAPVKLTKTTPEANSEIDHFDATTSYVLLNFDCPIKLTDDQEAYLRRVEDGEYIASLSLASGNIESTKTQIKVGPTSTVYLFEGVKYEVVVSAGSICDYANSETSLNEEIVIPYTGSYIRQSGNDNVMFQDTFDDPNASLTKWINYEGDHNVPLAEQQAWGFDANNTPWNFSTHDSEDSPDYFATSHSLYAPSGTSDDWMLTSQLTIPSDGKAVLIFDAQKQKNKDDHLWIYVIPESRTISYLNDANMAILKEEAILLDEITDLNCGNNGKMEGNWKRYQYSLANFAGQDVYIAFVNKNTNQSCVMVNNVSVEREILYTIGFSNEDRVIGLNEINIKGTFTIMTKDFATGAVSLTLKDEQGTEISRIEWPNISGTSVVNRPIPMNFANALPLTLGKENKFTIEVVFDGKTADGSVYKNADTFNSGIYNLAFKPTKRVVLEEMTGITCPNCPQGHIAIEACERQYKDQFIPVSIHSYDGDELGAQFQPYSSALKLNAAPSARINRIEGMFYPMVMTGNALHYDMPEQNLWYNVIAKELDKPALCDIAVNAKFSADNKNILYTSNLKYAINTKQQTSLFLVVLEDSIEMYQENNFANMDIEGIGEWGLGGIYGNYYAYPVMHNDVVRSVIGETFSGTIGMFPSEFIAGQTYSTEEYTVRVNESVLNPKNLKIVAMLIDTQTGEIINAAVSKVEPGLPDPVETETPIALSSMGYATYYNSDHDLRLSDGMTASVVTSASNGKLTYKTIADAESEANTVPMGTAVLLKGAPDHTVTCTLIEYGRCEAYTGANLLHGSDAATETTADGSNLYYKLAWGSANATSQNIFGWFWGADEGAAFNIEGHKAWLAVPVSTAAKISSFAIDATTAISGTKAETANTSIYDLQGRKVSGTVKAGIYIQGNKKVIIK